MNAKFWGGRGHSSGSTKEGYSGGSAKNQCSRKSASQVADNSIPEAMAVVTGPMETAAWDSGTRTLVRRVSTLVLR